MPQFLLFRQKPLRSIVARGFSPARFIPSGHGKHMDTTPITIPSSDQRPNDDFLRQYGTPRVY